MVVEAAALAASVWSAETTAAGGPAAAAAAGRPVMKASASSTPAMRRPAAMMVARGRAVPARAQMRSASGGSAPVSRTAQGRPVVQTDVVVPVAPAITCTTSARTGSVFANHSVKERHVEVMAVVACAGSVAAGRTVLAGNAPTRHAREGRAALTDAADRAGPVPASKRSATRGCVSASPIATGSNVETTAVVAIAVSVRAARPARTEPAPSRLAMVSPVETTVAEAPAAPASNHSSVLRAPASPNVPLSASGRTAVTTVAAVSVATAAAGRLASPTSASLMSAKEWSAETMGAVDLAGHVQ